MLGETTRRKPKGEIVLEEDSAKDDRASARMSNRETPLGSHYRDKQGFGRHILEVFIYTLADSSQPGAAQIKQQSHPATLATLLVYEGGPPLTRTKAQLGDNQLKQLKEHQLWYRNSPAFAPFPKDRKLDIQPRLLAVPPKRRRGQVVEKPPVVPSRLRCDEDLGND